MLGVGSPKGKCRQGHSLALGPGRAITKAPPPAGRLPLYPHLLAACEGLNVLFRNFDNAVESDSFT